MATKAVIQDRLNKALVEIEKLNDKIVKLQASKGNKKIVSQSVVHKGADYAKTLTHKG